MNVAEILVALAASLGIAFFLRSLLAYHRVQRIQKEAMRKQEEFIKEFEKLTKEIENAKIRYDSAKRDLLERKGIGLRRTDEESGRGNP